MLYWEDHQPKRLVFHTSSGAFPVFSCIKIRYFIEEYFGSAYVDALTERRGFFMFGNLKITCDEINRTFEDFDCVGDAGFEDGARITWHTI